MSLKRAEEEEEEWWFFTSIQRYDHLYMYDLEIKDEEKPLWISISPSGDRWALLTSKDLSLYASPTSLKPSGVNLPKRDAPLIAGVYLKEAPKLVAFLTEDVLVTPESYWKTNDTDLLQRGRDLSLQNATLSHSIKSRILALTSTSLYSIDPETDSVLIPEHSDIVSAIYDAELSLLKKNGSVWTNNQLDFELKFSSAPQHMKLLSPKHVFAALESKDGLKYYEVYEKENLLFQLKDQVLDVLLSPNQEYLSFISKDHTVKVLSLALRGKEVFVHDGHKSAIISHAWHPTIPNTVYSVDTDKNVHIWKFKILC